MSQRIKDNLSPEWLRDCVMIEKEHSAIIIAPERCLEHGITNLKMSQNNFSSKTILQFRLDFDIRKVKKK